MRYGVIPHSANSKHSSRAPAQARLRRLRLLLPGVTAGALVGGLVMGAPALANDAVDFADPSAVLSGAAERLIGPSTDRIEVDAGGVAARSSMPTGPSVTFTAPDFDQVTTIQLAPSLVLAGESDGYTVFVDHNQQLASYVKATPSGGQAIYAVGSSSTAADILVGFPVATGATLLPAVSAEGYFLDLDNGTSVFVHPARAYDSAGREIASEYRLDDGNLVQHIDAPADAVYPLFAAPTWWYAVDYGIGNRTPASARSTMKSCFNCKFPVQGAPASFPSPGQLLPLVVGPFPGYPWPLNFECRFRQEEWRPYPPEMGGPAWGFIFDATANHVDGYGSWISFDTFQKPGESTYSLRVYGEIVNTNPGGVPQAIYTTGATVNWSVFAGNLNL